MLAVVAMGSEPLTPITKWVKSVRNLHTVLRRDRRKLLRQHEKDAFVGRVPDWKGVAHQKEPGAFSGVVLQ